MYWCRIVYFLYDGIIVFKIKKIRSSEISVSQDKSKVDIKGKMATINKKQELTERNLVYSSTSSVLNLYTRVLRFFRFFLFLLF